MLALKNIWTEKYRPKCLDDLIVSEEVKKIIKSYEDEIPNLLFVGSPGVGKTSLAKVIVNSLLGCNYLYINASDESGIDMIRNKVGNFSMTKSFDGKVKVVILDESDGMSPDAQKALRNTMETYAKNTRFILTANYKHKVIPAVQSRCQEIDVKPDIKGAVQRCALILKEEGIKVDDDQKNNFVALVKAFFPDLRKTINELQKSSITGKLVVHRITNDTELLDKIYNDLKANKVIPLRNFLIENEERFSGDYDNLLNDFLNHLYKADMDDTKKKMSIVTIAQHLYEGVFVVDKEINCYACLIKLEGLLA
jgi:DNA polymerase III delta prime subunit